MSVFPKGLPGEPLIEAAARPQGLKLRGVPLRSSSGMSCEPKSGFWMGNKSSSSISKRCNLVSVDEGYSLWAETYDADPNPLLSAEERMLRPLLPSLAGKVVLDVACGTGRWLEKMLRAGAAAGSGVDVSSAMLRAARLKPFLQGRVARGDCLALPFRPEVADLILCSFAVSHIGNLDAFAQELTRVAKCSADVYVSDLHPEAYASGWRTGFRHKNGRAEFVSFSHSTDELRGTFRSHGFELSQFHETRLGKAEEPVFERAGKSHLFPGACNMPAVYVCHFTRSGPKRDQQLALAMNAS